MHRGLETFRLFGVDGWTFVVDGLVLCVAWGVVLLGSGVVRWPGYFREPLLATLLVVTAGGAALALQSRRA